MYTYFRLDGLQSGLNILCKDTGVLLKKIITLLHTTRFFDERTKIGDERIKFGDERIKKFDERVSDVFKGAFGFAALKVIPKRLH